jgi:tRNA-specific 2-thiouridylase
MAKIMVAMSGGVDSSLAAALLHEAGHDVTGVTLHLWEGDDDRLAESLCCSQEMTESARRVCAQLGIPYYVFNYQREFRRYVIEYFLREYANGFTPNPCLECNREIKFRALLARARTLGFDYVATGHYARIRADEMRHNGEDAGLPSAERAQCSTYRLLRAVDREKDQSYMLYMLGQDDLARLIFPIGEYTKAEVRAMAAARGLASANRPESQDICFVPGGDYRNLLREERPRCAAPRTDPRSRRARSRQAPGAAALHHRAATRSRHCNRSANVCHSARYCTQRRDCRSRIGAQTRIAARRTGDVRQRRLAPGALRLPGADPRPC